jgi:hypothetical protein
MKKIFFKFLTISLFLIFQNSLYAQTGYLRMNIPVTENADTLKLPFGGGLTNPDFSNIDLDRDGTSDIFIYDKCAVADKPGYGYRITPILVSGTPGNPIYTHAPQYIDSFPTDFYNWVLLKDFNCDGFEDIFCGSTFSNGSNIHVYKNTTPQMGYLSFTEFKNPLVSEYFQSSFAPLFVLATDIPALTDVDNDSDLDILVFNSFYNTIEWHKNMSMENYGTCDSLAFLLEDECWGLVAESPNDASVILNIQCPSFMEKSMIHSNQKTSLHAGSTLVAFDGDGDGDKELVIGDVSFVNMTYLENGGTPTSALIVAQDTPYPSSNTPIDLNLFPCAYYTDITNDGNPDLLVSPFARNSCDNYESVLFYENTGSFSSPVFNFISRKGLQGLMTDLGAGFFPAFVDVDADGLLDIIAGNDRLNVSGQYNFSGLAYFRNTGNATSPAFDLVTRDYGNFSSTFSPIRYGFYPTFGDMDADGDLDMILGDAMGKVSFFRNSAGAGQPLNLSMEIQDYNGIDVGAYAAPQLIDMDRDGLLDLVIGEESSTLNYFRNTGTASSFQFASIPDNDFFGGVEIEEDCCTGYSTPFFMEYTVPGAYDLFLGSERGMIFQYGNIDGNLSGSFTLVDSFFMGFKEGGRTTFAAADLTGDGDPEFAIGNYCGGFALFERSTVSIPSGGFSDSGFRVYPNPITNATIFIESFKTHSGQVSIELIDLNGRLIFSDILSFYSGKTSISTDFLQSGMYLLKVKTSENTGNFKVVITRNQE